MLVLLRETLGGERQDGGVGELKQHQAQAENQQEVIFGQFAQPRRVARLPPVEANRARE